MKSMGIIDAFCEKNSSNALKKKPKVRYAVTILLLATWRVTHADVTVGL
jgi:hypothetical protein